MQPLMRSTIGILSGLLIIAAGGCGGGDGKVDVYPVKGTVTFNGKPMIGGGSITFVPTSPQEGKTAGGIINEDGTYEMTTYAEGDGSMAGTFRVVVTQVTVQEPDYGGDSDAGGTAPGEPVETVGMEDRIPPIYSDAAQSPATVTVEEKDNVIDIKLEPQQSQQQTGA